MGSGLSLSGVIHPELTRSGELVSSQVGQSLLQGLMRKAPLSPMTLTISSGSAGFGAVCHCGGSQADKTQEGDYQ